MNIRKWLEFLDADNNEDRSKIIKFIFIWMKYNQWYNEAYPEIRGDKKKALEINKNKDAIDAYLPLKENFLNTFKNIPSIHCSIGSRDCLWADNALENEVLFNEQYCDLKQFLTLIYQIRCNFLHGDKELDKTNIKLVIWAHDSLYSFLKAFGFDLSYHSS